MDIKLNQAVGWFNNLPLVAKLLNKCDWMVTRQFKVSDRLIRYFSWPSSASWILWTGWPMRKAKHLAFLHQRSKRTFTSMACWVSKAFRGCFSSRSARIHHTERRGFLLSPWCVFVWTHTVCLRVCGTYCVHLFTCVFGVTAAHNTITTIKDHKSHWNLTRVCQGLRDPTHSTSFSDTTQ